MDALGGGEAGVKGRDAEFFVEGEGEDEDEGGEAEEG